MKATFNIFCFIFVLHFFVSEGGKGGKQKSGAGTSVKVFNLTTLTVSRREAVSVKSRQILHKRGNVSIGLKNTVH